MKYIITERIKKEQVDVWEYETDLSERQLRKKLQDGYFQPGVKTESYEVEKGYSTIIEKSQTTTQRNKKVVAKDN